MELWIRSQDKTTLLNYNLIGMEMNMAESSTGKWCFIGDHYAIMGTYESKERALEVLDEIQKHREKIEKMYFLGIEEAIFEKTTYEMPKE